MVAAVEKDYERVIGNEKEIARGKSEIEIIIDSHLPVDLWLEDQEQQHQEEI